MTIIKRAAGAVLERRVNTGQEWGNSVPPTNGMLGGGTGYGDENSALQVAAVYGCVGIIADAVSTLPTNLYDSADPTTSQKLPPSPLMTQPYSEISRITWLTQFTISLALRGHFWGHIIQRDENLNPLQVKPIHPDHAKVRRLPSGDLEYRFYGQIVAAHNVVSVPYQSLAEGLVGLNPIEYLRTTYSLARNAQLYGNQFFHNSALPGGWIGVKGDLDEVETLELARGWNIMHQGIGKAHLPAVLTGDASFHPISITPEDAQFLATQQFSQSQIAGMIFRVPLHMIGIQDRTSSWGTGIEQMEMGFVRNTVQGYLSRYEEMMTALHPPNQYALFDLSKRLRGDRLQRYQAYNIARAGGWMNGDEIRHEEEMPPMADGQGKIYLVPINSQTIDQAQAETDLSQPKLDPGATDGNTQGEPNP